MCSGQILANILLELTPNITGDSCQLPDFLTAAFKTCYMNRLTLVGVLLLFFSGKLFAQNGVISGKILDERGSPLSSVNITIKNASGGVQTNEQGEFRLPVTGAGPFTLVISAAGYKTQEVTAQPGGTVNLAMEVSTTNLDDVVVVGYQTMRRRDLTSSVSSVSARDLKDIPINSAAEAIAGRLAGVQIIKSEGSPDASAVIRVRGGGSITQDNSPLFIVDGIQVENALSVLAPQDIESIDVLKDASATAIYGARGANGVVIITTKGGRDMKTQVNYNGLIGFRKLANKLEVMNPYEFVIYQYERTRGGQQDRDNFLNTYGHWEDLELYKKAPFVDWQEEMFGRRALMQTHNVSVVGGNANTKFNLSVTANKEEGVMRLSDFDRKLINFRFDHNVNKKLKVGLAVRYNNTVVNGAGTANEGSSATNRLRHSVKFRPLLMANQDLLDYDPDYALQTNANSLALVNPILLNEAEYRRNYNSTANFSGYFDYTINKYLSLRSTLGFDLTNNRRNAFNDTITSVAKQNANMPTASIHTFNRQILNNSNVLTFTMKRSGSNFTKRHELDVLVGQELYEDKDRNYLIETRYFPVGITAQAALGNMRLGSAPAGSVQPPPTSEEVTRRLFSFFGRVNYSFDKRFTATFSLRADGSSKFSEDNRWGYFPSGAIAWTISEEKFMQDLLPAISFLKLRASYGEAGNNRIGDFLYLSQFKAEAFYSIGDQLITVFNPDELANANLKWETTISRNLGLDMGFLNNRLQLTVDAYYNSTRDLLVKVPVPTSSGYVEQIQNVGATSNKGVEFQLNATPVLTRNFDWRANFNISFNRNKIESINAYQSAFLFRSGWAGSNVPHDYIVKVGEQVGTIWGFVYDGWYTIDDFDFDGTTYTLKTGIANNSGIIATDPQPGVLKFKDISGPDGKPDGVINDYDRTIIGRTQPKFFGGLNQQFRYKNFDLSVFINFQVGNDVYNANKLEFASGYTINSNLLALMNDRWRTINDQGEVVVDPAELAALNRNAKEPQPLRSAGAFHVHSWAIEDGSFMRINNVTLGYSLPQNLTRKLKINSFRIYATVNNLYVLTNYSGYDPEVNTRRSSPLTPGVDYSAYPRSRAYIVGLNLSL
jgi:TonB-linked outer membrane protein, SusC/RagA family